MNNDQPEQGIETRADALRELQVKLNEALQALPHTQRIAIVLKEIDGLPIESIAEISSCSIQSVFSHVNAAQKKLEKNLGAYMRSSELLRGTSWNIGDLLRLKKMETPGELYFDRFLAEFHRYQRASILQERSAWREFFESCSEFLFTVPRPVAAIATVVAIAAIVALVNPISGRVDSGPSFVSVPQMDKVVTDVFVPEKKGLMDVSVHYADPLLQQPELQRPIPVVEEQDLSAPRYVTGNTASSYDATLAF
ncbi:MAG: RNA polymerase sigma factor [Verrucomicrobiota bacterium]